MSDEIACPFCGETCFDATGLKIHLLAGYCDTFNAVSTDIQRMCKDDKKEDGK